MASKKNKVVPIRLSTLRTKLELSQENLANLLFEESENNINIGIQSISNWETGRRPVPDSYVPYLAKVLETTVEYLTGQQNDFEEAPPSLEPNSRPRFEINYKYLYMFDKEPVFVVFLDYEHENGWALYDKKNEYLFFGEGDGYKLKTSNVSSLVFYALRPSHSPSPTLGKLGKKITSVNTMLRLEYVYIEINCPDEQMQLRYDGWYRHNELKNGLIKENGLCLPYEGLNISYNAYYIDENNTPANF